jgi:NAD(P)-dependent dehydrogenase (short-subunit alcohol dehydrogenase family)
MTASATRAPYPGLGRSAPELVDRLSKMNPLERLGTPQDIANAVAFLVPCCHCARQVNATRINATPDPIKNRKAGVNEPSANPTSNPIAAGATAAAS